MRIALKKTGKQLQLMARFACRRIGIKNFQIHQICLQKQRLIYIPIPKNACSSTKEALHEIEFGRPFDAGRPVNAPFINIHDYYKKRPGAFTGTDSLEFAVRFTRFAIVRDPLERLISCYRNRVVDLGDLQNDVYSLQKYKLSAEPDLNTFVLNLMNYRKASKSIEHHSRPQSAFVGGRLDYLDYIFPFEKIDSLNKLLRNYSPTLKMLKRKSGGTKVDISELSEEALEFATWFYKKDYALLKEYYSPLTSE